MQFKLILIISIIALIFASVFLFTQNFSLPEADPPLAEEIQNTVRIGESVLEVDISKTFADKARGLSGRESLGEDQGMLFIYDEPSIYFFWMKDMNFGLDIIWIDANKKIVDITRDVRPESYPDTFEPQSPAQYVLEVNSGWAERHGVKIGDLVEL